VAPSPTTPSSRSSSNTARREEDGVVVSVLCLCYGGGAASCELSRADTYERKERWSVRSGGCAPCSSLCLLEYCAMLACTSPLSHPIVCGAPAACVDCRPAMSSLYRQYNHRHLALAIPIGKRVLQQALLMQQRYSLPSGRVSERHNRQNRAQLRWTWLSGRMLVVHSSRCSDQDQAPGCGW